MGRELKRVPLDFNAPLKETWKGYVSPDWRPCPANCENGSTPAAAWVEKIMHLLLMLPDAAVDTIRPLHPWLEELPLRPDQRPSREILELTAGLCGREWSDPFGHDAIDRWKATTAIFKAADLPEDWGICKVCGGHTIHPDDLATSEAWEPTDPPIGDGFQLWETTSEGSPISPVFATLDALCEWAETGATFGSATATAQEWKQMLDQGFVHFAAGNGMIFI